MDRGVPTTVDATRLRYQLALETSMDGFALVGTEGRLLEVNQALCSISRCPRAEMLAANLLDFAAPPPGTSVPEMMTEILGKGRARFEAGWRCRDGVTLDVEVSVTTATDPLGVVFFAFIRDITQSKQIARDLEESRLRAKAFFNLAPLSKVVYRMLRDGDGTIVDWEISDINDPAAASIGRTAGDAIGLRMTETIGADLMAPQLERSRRLERDGVCAPFQDDFPLGKRHYLSNLFAVGQDLLGMVSVDITEQVETRAALSESEQKFRLLAENSKDVIWLGDVPSRRFTYVSPSIQRLRGFTPAEVMALPLEAALSGDSARKMFSALEERIRALEDGDESQRTAVLQVTQPCKDGALIETEIVTTFLSDPSGKVTQVLGVTRDVSARRKADEAIRDSEGRFRSLFETMTLGVVYREASGEIIAANPAAERMLGLPLAEMRGRSSFSSGLELVQEDGSPLPWDEHPPIAALRTGKTILDRAMGIRAPAREGTTWLVVTAVPQFREGEANPYRVFSTFRDVTEERRLADQLRVRESALVSSLNPMAMAGLDGTLNWVNTAFLSDWGYASPSEVLDRPVLDFWRDADDAAAALGLIMAGKVWVGELAALRKDGTAFEAHVEARRIEDPDGLPVCVVGSFVDVSYRKRLEAQLRREKESLETASASGKVTTWEWDLASGMLEWSGHVDPLLASTLDTVHLTAVAFAERIHADDRAPFVAAIREHAKAGTPFVLEFRIQRADGSYAWWRDVGACHRDGNGTVVRLSGACVDITELKQAQFALEASKEQLEEAQTLALTGSWEFDAVTGRIEWSRETFRLFEVDPAEFRHTYEAMLELIHPEDREMLNAAYTKSVAERTVYELEHRLLMPDGRVKWMRERGRTEFDADGAPVRSIGTIQDITEHRLAQEARQLTEAKEAAEAANRAKSAFLASMSHEIRTPMNAILGFSQLLLGEPGLTSRQLDQLQAINRSGEHLLTLINDILEMSKIEAGRVTLNAAEMDLHSFFWDLESIFRLKASEKGLVLRVERAGDLPRHVLADEMKLRQILINLMGNAVKFAKEGSVTVRAWSQPSAQGEIRLRISVEDNGPGIPAEDLSRLFQHFEQTLSGRETRTGTGLGLAISQGFAKLMGGEITVRSRVGVGSIFNLDVAVGLGSAVSLPPAGPVRATAVPVTVPRRILVADDIVENRQILVGMLSRVGYEVRTATDGSGAVDLFSSWRPHLVLMDLRMPGLGGLDAIRSIRATPGGAAVPIVAVTASTFEEDRRMVEEAGGDGFVAKPFREADLVRTVGELLEASPGLEEAPTAESPAPFGAIPAFRIPPEPFRGALLAATARGDLDRILRLADELEEIDPEGALTIRALAEQFDYERLRILIEAGGPDA